MIRRYVAAGAALSAAAALSVAGGAGAMHSTATVRPIPVVADHIASAKYSKTVPTTASCEASFGIACYSPLQYQQAYDLKPLYGKGITGAGHTIAIVDSFGSPTIAADLATFDQTWGLPDPPSLKIIQPAGAVPAWDPTDSTMTGWGFETTLDVEYAHAIAPGANILLVETPVAETEGVTGFPEIVKAENYVINNGLADVITQSFGATEQTFPSKASLLALRSAFKNAAAHHVTVLASSGDSGATDSEADGTTNYPMRVNSWPSSDPLVTSVGGTQLHLDADGNRTSPDVAWNDGYGAGGGGVSEYFSRPAFQSGVRSVVGSRRGTPDVSMTAAVNGGAIVYLSYPGATPGYYIVGGTSESTPIFSGVVALAAQVAHHRLGTINPALYQMVHLPGSGIVDITSGNNSFSGVTGYTAGKGYDLASGLGTVDAAKFVPYLALYSSIA